MEVPDLSRAVGETRLPVVAWTDPAVDPFATLGITGDVALSMGVFDGVHRGHQELLRRLTSIDTAARGVLTFWPSPARYFRPATFPGYVTTLPQRLARFAQFGVDFVVVLAFSQRFREMAGGDFVATLHAYAPRLREVVVGFNFHLGRGRELFGESLAHEFAGNSVKLDIVDALTDNSGSISSSRVRESLTKGKVQLAARLLGRPYAIDGRFGLPSHREESEQIIPSSGNYSCVYRSSVRDIEGYLTIRPEGAIEWSHNDARWREVELITSY